LFHVKLYETGLGILSGASIRYNDGAL